MPTALLPADALMVCAAYTAQNRWGLMAYQTTGPTEHGRSNGHDFEYPAYMELHWCTDCGRNLDAEPDHLQIERFPRGTRVKLKNIGVPDAALALVGRITHHPTGRVSLGVEWTHANGTKECAYVHPANLRMAADSE